MIIMSSFDRIFDLISQNTGKATVIVINNLNEQSAVPAQQTLSSANKKLYVPRAESAGREILLALGTLGAVSRETACSKARIAAHTRTERRSGIKVKYL